MGTALLMAVCSAPPVWDALSENPTMANPSLILVRLGSCS